MTQIALFPTAVPAPRAEQVTLPIDGTIEARYQAWRRTEEGQLVWQEVLNEALLRQRTGARRISTKALVEWSRAVLRRSINNSFTAPLARDLIAAEPGLAGLIERRERRAT